MVLNVKGFLMISMNFQNFDCYSSIFLTMNIKMIWKRPCIDNGIWTNMKERSKDTIQIDFVPP